jgi:hypothetical protein
LTPPVLSGLRVSSLFIASWFLEPWSSGSFRSFGVGWISDSQHEMPRRLVPLKIGTSRRELYARSSGNLNRAAADAARRATAAVAASIGSSSAALRRHLSGLGGSRVVLEGGNGPSIGRSKRKPIVWDKAVTTPPGLAMRSLYSTLRCAWKDRPKERNTRAVAWCFLKKAEQFERRAKSPSLAVAHCCVKAPANG